MPNMLSNFGLEFLAEEETTFMNFLCIAAEKGKPIKGYYGIPYLYSPFGSFEMWLKSERDCNGSLTVVDFDTHGGNRCAWEMEHIGIDLTPSDYSKLEKIAMFKDASSGEGAVPIEVINPDVLPSFMKGDKITMQMIALPVEVNYYEDEEEYSKANSYDRNGERWSVGVGALLPLAFLANHNPISYDPDKEYTTDSCIWFAAKVEKLLYGDVELNGEKHNTYIKCFINTKFGRLELDHTIDMVPESLRCNMRVGSIISGVCILSADVAIKTYANGIVRDFDNNLKLLRYTMSGGDPERMRSVLSYTAVYETDTSNSVYNGPDSIIERFKYVNARENKYTTYYATITEALGNTEYPVGARCIVLSGDEEGESYESIAFLETDSDGLISRIKVSTDKAYRFRVEK